MLTRSLNRSNLAAAMASNHLPTLFLAVQKAQEAGLPDNELAPARELMEALTASIMQQGKVGEMLRSVIERKDSELDAELIQIAINLATAMQLPADDPLFAQAQAALAKAQARAGLLAATKLKSAVPLSNAVAAAQQAGFQGDELALAEKQLAELEVSALLSALIEDRFAQCSVLSAQCSVTVGY